VGGGGSAASAGGTTKRRVGGRRPSWYRGEPEGPMSFGKSRGGEKIGQLDMRGEERNRRIQRIGIMILSLYRYRRFSEISFSLKD
jgi:hypothetical protein